MSASLVDNRYGKAGIRLFRVTRDTDRHEIADLAIDVFVRGRFDDAHLTGDNAALVPTDTMRGTVYAFAKQAWDPRPEVFGRRLAEHFLGTIPAVEEATVRLAASPWERIGVDGRGHDHAFTGRGEERWLTTVTADADGVSVSAGIDGLHLLKTNRSAFAGFFTDRYTTLPETDDRILATVAVVDWRYDTPDVDWDAARTTVRRCLVETFAEHDSQSLQHTLYAMGRSVVQTCDEVEEISLSMPNRHHLLVDLAPYDLVNPGEIFVATDEPFGVIEGVVRRGA